jgi:hypothetical protein
VNEMGDEMGKRGCVWLTPSHWLVSFLYTRWSYDK